MTGRKFIWTMVVFYATTVLILAAAGDRSVEIFQVLFGGMVITYAILTYHEEKQLREYFQSQKRR